MKRKTYCITFCLSFFTLLFLAATILSCSAENQNIPNKETAETNRTAKLLLKVKDANVRTIFAANVEKENMSYTLSGFLADEENHEIKHWDTYSDMTGDDEIKVAAGNWTFTLDAELENTALYSETISQEIIEGENSITFTLSEVADALTSGQGSIDVTLSYPAEAGVSKIEAKLISAADYENLDYDEIDFVDSKTFTVAAKDDSISYSKTAIPSGVYVLQFSFYKSDDSELQPDYSEAVQVKNGRTSKKTITIETLESSPIVSDGPYEFTYKGESYWDYVSEAEGRDFIIKINSKDFEDGSVETRDLLSFYSELVGNTGIDKEKVSIEFLDAENTYLEGFLRISDNLANLKEIIYKSNSLPQIAFYLTGGGNLYSIGMSRIIDKYILSDSLDKLSYLNIGDGFYFDAKELITNPPSELLNDPTYSRDGTMYTGDEYNRNAFLLDINTALLFGERVSIKNCSIGYKLLNPTNHLDRSAALLEETIFTDKDHRKLGPLTNVRIKIDASDLQITGADGVLEFMDKPTRELPAGSDKLKLILHHIWGDHIPNGTLYNIDLSEVPESEMSLWPGFGAMKGRSITVPYAGYPTGHYFENVFYGRDEVESKFTAENFEKIGNNDPSAEPIS